MLNIKVRLKNPVFWVSLISSLIVLFGLFGIDIYQVFGNGVIGNFLKNYEEIINLIFAILAILGIVVDPTTKGIKDSQNALTYVKPKE